MFYGVIGSWRKAVLKKESASEPETASKHARAGQCHSAPSTAAPPPLQPCHTPQRPELLHLGAYQMQGKARVKSTALPPPPPHLATIGTHCACLPAQHCKYTSNLHLCFVTVTLLFLLCVFHQYYRSKNVSHHRKIADRESYYWPNHFLI